MSIARPSSLLAVLVLCASVGAQVSVGPGTPGTGGIVPELVSAQPWLGNGGYTLGIEGGLGGAVSLLVISPLPASVVLGGLPLYVDLPTALPILTAPLGGTAGVPGSGSFSFSFPLLFPALPSLAGATFYAQGAVLDVGGGFPAAVTNGLAISLEMPPLMFWGSSQSGSTDPYAFVDPLAMTNAFTGGVNETNNVTSADFSKTGLRLFAGTSLGSSVRVADLSAGSPVWSTLTSFASGAVTGVRYDKVRKLIWALADPGTGANELVVIDGDQASATYGQVMGNTTGVGAMTGLTERWCMNDQFTLAAVPTVLGTTITLWDTDPQSPTFLQNAGFLVVPSTGGIWVNGWCDFTPDGNELWLLRITTNPNPGDVARYSFSLGAWIDHDPTTPFVDHLGPNLPVPVNIGGGGQMLVISPAGGSAVVVGQGNACCTPWAVRIAYDPANPASYSAADLPGPVLGFQACAYAPDGLGFAVVRTAMAGGEELVFHDDATLTELGSAPVNSTQVTTLVWR